MAGPRTIDDAERRARLGRRHALAEPVLSPEHACAAVVALHSSDPISVHLSTWARTEAAPSELERALYTDRTLVRLHGMRRTLWVVPVALEPAVRVGAGRPLVAPDRARLVKALAAAGEVADPERWLDELGDAVVAAVEEAGEATAVELGRAVPGLATKVVYGQGTKWPTEVSVASRLLVILGFEGRIVRSRPLGTWVSGQYRYAPGSALERPPDPTPAAARAEVVGSYVARFGPVTEADVRWWTRWTAAQVRTALAAAGAAEVAVDGGPAFVAGGDDAEVPAPDPWVALLPGLDPTTMGWKGRDWYLGELGPVLFDRNGNAGPTVWADGRVVGGWAQRPDGEVVVDLRTDVGADARRAIDGEAERLAAWFGGVVATPRFRTPLERALVAGTELP
ncbi:winged helix DNA-binding domain-containing protein [Iamia sp. SCSIO 61187]|uniref:winged helix DNA-binding domain-containing protein n=1 Tax=Iamia sp. SCSIO 61187 TaxID=2722752 RepID=UPI001C637E10|nr:winged helix DNA-binding domain-containing protein [Iamia sp. SCSIO 61187]